MRAFRTMAVAGAAALALTACSGGGGGASDLPADAPPAEVVAAGLSDRLDNGAAFTVVMEGDLQALAEASGEPLSAELERMLTEGLVSGALSPDGEMALSIGADDGFLEVRALEEGLYLRFDIDEIGETFPEAGDVPSSEQLRSQLETMPLPGEMSALAQAALSGEWVGITGLSQEALQDLARTMGQDVPAEEEVEAQRDAIKSILEERGLLDGTAFTERYLTVEGDGPTYDVTVMARDLVTTLEEVATEIEETVGAAATGGMQDVPDPQDVPESLSGFSVTVEDGTVTAISGDLAAIGESAGEPAEGIAPGDVQMTLRLDDLGDQLAVPDATTIDFEELMAGLMGAFMGGNLTG